MTEINWQEPPPHVGSNSQDRAATRAFAAELRANPRRWALWKRASPTGAVNARRGQPQEFSPPGSFEATTRNGDGKKADIYVRYVGEPS